MVEGASQQAKAANGRIVVAVDASVMRFAPSTIRSAPG
jgi:hypothetical protein